jgi:D-aminopeptidase
VTESVQGSHELQAVVAAEARKQATKSVLVGDSHGKFAVEENQKSACEELMCDYKTLFVCNIWSV